MNVCVGVMENVYNPKVYLSNNRLRDIWVKHSKSPIASLIMIVYALKRLNV